MRAEIQWVPVVELGEIRTGKQLSPASREASGQFPYLRVANVFDGMIDYSDVNAMAFTPSERKTYSLRSGDILLNEGQSLELVGRSALYDGPEGGYCFQNTLVRFRPGAAILPEYAQVVFSRWLSTGVFAAIAKKTTSIAHLGSDRFGSLCFPLIPLAEQRRIVKVLGAALAVQEAAQKSIDKIRSVRRGMLLELMCSVSESMPSENWVRVPLKDVVPSAEYGISEALDIDPVGIPVLRMNNIRDGRIEVDGLRYSPLSVPDRLVLRNGDVLFNRTNSIDHVGKTAMWRGELARATFASYLVRLNPDLRQIIPEYLVEWLQHPLIRQRVKAISTVAVQQVNVNPTKLRELEIDLPVALEDQRRIVASLAACDDRIRQEEEELAKLRKMKVGLADDMLAGAATQSQFG
ncbi:restriction endonuclease subunit S [Streptomyces sp. NBC_00291]|uniref:restriction endonuclease subunit S n=1 Tax=Streptomyces sp. NBC_00291 TaxID=2975704 RepID=UPI0022501275|nr:restriction endonuclease subunit S [Streptomyces sp. NBC_00291]MCX5154643.1 restriction endonuclease subunit S [Streptomyces sp. NBC_00291]